MVRKGVRWAEADRDRQRQRWQRYWYARERFEKRPTSRTRPDDVSLVRSARLPSPPTPTPLAEAFTIVMLTGVIQVVFGGRSTNLRTG